MPLNDLTDSTHLILELSPLHNGAYTRVSLRGSIATVAQPKEVRSLLKMLSWWSGAPVDVVLHVDGTNSGSRWLEVWDDVFLHVRGRHLFEIRFLINRATLAAGGSDE
jgi:hypothetical protein